MTFKSEALTYEGVSFVKISNEFVDANIHNKSITFAIDLSSSDSSLFLGISSNVYLAKAPKTSFNSLPLILESFIILSIFKLYFFDL